MSLFEVVKVVKRQIPFISYPIYTIVLKGKNFLVVTNYHAFTIIRDGQVLAVRPEQINRKDKVYIDVEMYKRDGSLYGKGHY